MLELSAYFIKNIQSLSKRRQDARLILFYKIMNSLAQVPFEAYKGTRRKHNMKFKQISHTTRQYRQSCFPKTVSAWNGHAFAKAPSLAVFRSSLPHNTIEEYRYRNRNPSTTILSTCVYKKCRKKSTSKYIYIYIYQFRVCLVQFVCSRG